MVYILTLEVAHRYGRRGWIESVLSAEALRDARYLITYARRASIMNLSN